MADSEERREQRRKYQREWDRKKRLANGGKPFEEAKCGTRSGYNKHLRENAAREKEGLEPIGPCEECRAANAEYQRSRRASGQ